MPKKLILAVVIFLVLGTASAYKLLNAKVEGITATGTIEITRTDVTPKVSGYLSELKLKEGDRVTRGQLVAQIGRPDLTAQKLRDEMALKKAEAQLSDLQKGARGQELLEAEVNVASARAVYDKARNDYERFEKLHRDGAVSTQQLDAARSAYEVAASAYEASRARSSLIQEGNREDTIAAQQLEVERSKAVVQLAKASVDDTLVTSPLDGLVLTKNFEPGEFVNAGASIATIGDLQDCWVKVYVSSTQLGLIQSGQAVTVKVDSFPGRVFEGKIKEISQNAEFTPRQSITKEERANMVFAVKVKIENPDGVLKPGMPADVVIK